jgi:TonB-linked SusC/RagA family outer membrane protein
MERLQMVNQPSIDKLLQGQVAGMTVINSSGAPGAVPQIRIRGAASISGSAQPLWVVDGIILDDPINASVDDILANRNLISSGIGGVNVDDIESIDILKDAAATALYGTRAANGVIIVSTRTGRIGKSQVRYNGSVGVAMRPQIADAYMMNSKERIDVNMEMIRRGVFQANSSQIGRYGTVSDFERLYIDVMDRKLTWGEFENKVRELEAVNTDWFDHLFQNAVTHRHNVDVSGGNEFATYYVSGSAMNEQSTAKGVGQQVYTGNVRVNLRLRDNLRLDAKINVSARENDSFFALDSWENPYEWSIRTTRAHRAYDENGDYNYMYYNNHRYNYLENRDQQWRESDNFGFTGNLSLEWNILKDLQFMSRFSIGKQNTSDIDIATEDSYYVRSRKENYYTVVDYIAVPYWSDGGWRQDRSTNAQSMTFTNQLSYMPVFDENNRLDFIVGNEVKTTDRKEIWSEAYGYTHNRGHKMTPQWEVIKQAGRAYWTEDFARQASLSFYGVAGYTFRNRYTLSLNWRVDMSNGFGLKTNKVINPVWAVGLNYQLAQENFLREADWVDYINLRGSYGTQGNLPPTAYSDVVASFTSSDGINPNPILAISSPKNPGLKWEKTQTVNAAVEFGLLNRRVSGIVEYYDRKTVDALSGRGVSQVTGFSNLQSNWASLRNSGWEFTLNTINVNNDKFRWTTNFNIGHNRNKVLDIQNPNPSVTQLTDAYRLSNLTSAIVGKPLDGLWSFRYAGLNEDGRAQFYRMQENADKEWVEDMVLQGVTNKESLVYSGSLIPPVQAGFTNTFNYKNFTLQALLVGSFGHVVRLRNLTNESMSGFGFPNPTQNMSREWASRWRQPGDEANTDVPKLEDSMWDTAVAYSNMGNSRMYDRSDLRTVKGDYVRLQNLSLSYDLNAEKLRRLGIQNIRFMVQGNNLFVLKDKKLKGVDPEASGQAMNYAATNNVRGLVSFGNTFLPLPRSYSFSMYIQF